jgi:hypothetical protein
MVAPISEIQFCEECGNFNFMLTTLFCLYVGVNLVNGNLNGKKKDIG